MEIKIDAVGRLDIPKKVRNLLHLQGGERLKLSVDEEKGVITLKKIENRCICCGTKENLISFGSDVFLCRRCMEEKAEII